MHRRTHTHRLDTCPAELLRPENGGALKLFEGLMTGHLVTQDRSQFMVDQACES